MVSLRDLIFWQPLKKEGEPENEATTESTDKNKMEISGYISISEFERIVAGGKDGYGKYKDFHGDYKDQMQVKFKDIVDNLKKEGKHIDRAYIHNLSMKLYNEPNQVSKLLARAMGYK